ncbi:hypothetical protein [Aliicoccus persicus]|uniref:Uncharacterized protein n=1 Tax=Aliicoccus persicus TaxID=930138 RepID=A0A662Z5B2_9STAP|nr:hypothetical protein [Aliicoccus persicus]SEW18170.1 hypothetical protein SAMN05192557_2005 [Aliicoccus persicus]
MKNSKYSKWTLTFGAVGAIIGLMLSQFINFNFPGMLGGLTAGVILILINIIIVMRKSDNTPEYDERIINNIKNYYFYASLVFIGTAFVLLSVLMIMEIEMIAVTTIFIAFFIYFAITGLGAMIVRRR